jgi:hypothetical protein
MVRILSWLTVIALFLPGTQAQIPPTQPRAQNIHTERYVINVNFFPAKGFLHATARVTLTGAKCPGAIELELNPHLTILEIRDGLNHNLEFDRSRRLGSSKLAVRLVEPCDSSSKTALVFTYEGVLPPGPLDYITKDGILLRDESRWYPAMDFSAFTDNDITIRLPKGWMTLNNAGEETQKAVPEGEVIRLRTFRAVSSRAIVAYRDAHAWSCDVDVQYFPPEVPKFMISNISYCSALPGDRSGGVFLDRIWGPVDFYRRLLEPVPYVRDPFHYTMRIVQGFPGQRGAIGYSAPGFLVVSEDIVKHAGEKDYVPEFLPHEIAHQWFPIEVTLALEEDGWLAESLAEYLAWRYLEVKSPDQARRMVVRAMRDALGPQPLLPLSRGLKLFGEEGWDVTHATLYDRGMLVWRTLETVIDRKRVDRALREYYRRYAGQSASIADFRKICEEISGRNLGWFFDYFINGTDLPEIELRPLPSKVPNEMAGEIRVKNVPPEFEVRVELLIDTARGPVNYSVATRGEVTPFTVAVPGPVLNVVLDPNSRILRRTGPAPKPSQPTSRE